jgi:hypothetical protein
MDDLEIAWRPLRELVPYARNPRAHSDAQVAQIAASIKEFGWTNPVLVDGRGRGPGRRREELRRDGRQARGHHGVQLSRDQTRSLNRLL